MKPLKDSSPFNIISDKFKTRKTSNTIKLKSNNNVSGEFNFNNNQQNKYKKTYDYVPKTKSEKKRLVEVLQNKVPNYSKIGNQKKLTISIARSFLTKSKKQCALVDINTNVNNKKIVFSIKCSSEEHKEIHKTKSLFVDFSKSLITADNFNRKLVSTSILRDFWIINQYSRFLNIQLTGLKTSIVNSFEDYKKSITNFSNTNFSNVNDTNKKIKNILDKCIVFTRELTLLKEYPSILLEPLFNIYNHSIIFSDGIKSKKSPWNDTMEAFEQNNNLILLNNDKHSEVTLFDNYKSKLTDNELKKFLERLSSSDGTAAITKPLCVDCWLLFCSCSTSDQMKQQLIEYNGSSGIAYKNWVQPNKEFMISLEKKEINQVLAEMKKYLAQTKNKSDFKISENILIQEDLESEHFFKIIRDLSDSFI